MNVYTSIGQDPANDSSFNAKDKDTTYSVHEALSEPASIRREALTLSASVYHYTTHPLTHTTHFIDMSVSTSHQSDWVWRHCI